MGTVYQLRRGAQFVDDTAEQHTCSLALARIALEPEQSALLVVTEQSAEQLNHFFKFINN